MESAQTGLTALLAILAIPALAALFVLSIFIYRHTVGKQLKTTLREDYEHEAARFERSGKFVSAARVYETKLKDLRKAAALYERGGDYRKASILYDLIGITDKARELYEKDGNITDAAEMSIREGEFEEAARLYGRAGKKIDEAVMMEKAGRRLPAIRAYREAGDYRNAARLLAAEGMHREAAEMFGLMLRGMAVDASSIDDYYAYAYRLEASGQAAAALAVYRQIDEFDPAYRDVREKVQDLAPEPHDDAQELRDGTTSIRSIIRSGYLEPKHAFKLWVQILRVLKDAHAGGRPCGLVAPENILIDTHNNISFLQKTPAAAYRAPEKTKGLEPDVHSDIFSLGVILYEMLTGGLEGLGSVRVTEVAPDVADWLDEIVIRCIRKVPEDRYQKIDDILADIKSLSSAKKTSA